MNQLNDVVRKTAGLSAVALAFVLASGPTSAGGGDSVSGFSGSFSQAIPIEVPALRGLEPRLALGYSSHGGGGFPGVGWGLAGFSVIERASPGLGSPRYDASDVFVFDGRELLPCKPGSPSPSCTTGGSHTAKVESYLKVRFDSVANSWTVWSKGGTRTILTPVFQTASGTLWWGQTSTIDTHGNTVTYTWACDNGDCYPDSVTFGPYSVKLYREGRPDVTSSATGTAGGLRQTRFRLRSILVQYQASPIRAYSLTYATSAVTARSLLTQVQQYGRDVAIDAAGFITGGTSLPPHSFQYATDPLGKSFQPRY